MYYVPLFALFVKTVVANPMTICTLDTTTLGQIAWRQVGHIDFLNG